MNREDRAKKIRGQLTKLASSRGNLSVNELRIVLALERIVARLVNNPGLENHLVYKGGFVLLKTLESDRFTRDLDALGVEIDKARVVELVPKALDADIGDGFWFGDIKVQNLEVQGEYGALRFDCAYQIGEPDLKKIAKLSRIHFDVGFGDSIPAKLKTTVSESLLQGDSPISWKVYPPEFMFSEKLQTLVQRASANSRAKDVYDLPLLFEQCKDKASLHKAVRMTFENRDTEIPASFYAFAKGLDLMQIEMSWRSVRLIGESDFQSVWKRLLTTLKKFDTDFFAQ